MRVGSISYQRRRGSDRPLIIIIINVAFEEWTVKSRIQSRELTSGGVQERRPTRPNAEQGTLGQKRDKVTDVNS